MLEHIEVILWYPEICSHRRTHDTSSRFISALVFLAHLSKAHVRYCYRFLSVVVVVVVVVVGVVASVHI